MNPSLIPVCVREPAPWFNICLKIRPVFFSHWYLGTLSRRRNHLLPASRQPVVVQLPLPRAFLLVQSPPYPADSLGGLPEREAFRVVAQVQVPPIENLPHVARVARVETYPGRVRWKKSIDWSIQNFNVHKREKEEKYIQHSIIFLKI